MIVPLNVNVDMATRLKKCLKKFPHELKLVDNILISSNIVLLHAHDLLDQRLIEEGTFIAMYIEADIVMAIDEIVQVISMTLKERHLKIVFDANYHKKQLPKLKFDKRRL